jgi:hypothetical protein
MLIIVLIVIITVVLLIGLDRVSGRQTTDGRSLKEAEDRFLNKFLHRRSQHRRRQPKPCIPTTMLGNGLGQDLGQNCELYNTPSQR